MRATIATATLAALLAATSARANGQSREAAAPAPANLVFMEVAGPCIFGSLNYERVVANVVHLRAGVGWIPDIDPFGSDGGVIEQVFTVGSLFGTGRHDLEIAAGAVVGEPTNGGRWGVRATAVIGYRFQSAGTVFRIGATPLVRVRSWGADESAAFLPLFGLSFGQSW
jgi:hypothetical protein